MGLGRILDLTERAASIVAALSLACVALLTAAAVALRAIGGNVPDALDFSSLLMGVTVFWAAAIAFRHDDNVRIDFLASLLGPRAGRLTRALANLVTAGFVILMVIAGTEQLGIAFRGGEVTPQLRLSLWPFVAFAWTGLAVTAMVASAVAVTSMGPAGRRPRSRTPAEPAEDGMLYGE